MQHFPKDPVQQNYKATKQVLAKRMQEAWNSVDVIKTLNDVMKKVMSNIIAWIEVQAVPVNKEREKLKRMQERLDTVFGELKNKGQDWNSKTFTAMTDGIKEDLKMRKYQHYTIDKVEIETSIWRLLTKRMKFSTNERFDKVFTKTQEHVDIHENFISGVIKVMNKQYEEAIEQWKAFQDQITDINLKSPGIQRELGALAQIEEAGLKDLDQSFKHYQEAALNGSVIALHSLGIIYKNGRGDVQQDLSKSKYFFEMAAERGCAPSCSVLGIMYEKGTDGVQVDLYKAKAYYLMALGLSSRNAKQQLDSMKKLPSPPKKKKPIS